MDTKKNILQKPDSVYAKAETEKNILQEPDAIYEKAETDQLKDALKRTYTERFLMTTRLYKIQQMLQRAKITHQPYTLDK